MSNKKSAAPSAKKQAPKKGPKTIQVPANATLSKKVLNAIKENLLEDLGGEKIPPVIQPFSERQKQYNGLCKIVMDFHDGDSAENYNRFLDELYTSYLGSENFPGDEGGSRQRANEYFTLCQIKEFITNSGNVSHAMMDERRAENNNFFFHTLLPAYEMCMEDRETKTEFFALFGEVDMYRIHPELLNTIINFLTLKNFL